jgi:outer membrane protein assembly factor BamB
MVVLPSAFGADTGPHWDRFRGPNGQGICEDARPPSEFGLDRNMRWRTPVPEAYGSFVHWGDHLFLTGMENEQLVILSLSTKDGSLRWKQTIASRIDPMDYMTGNGHRVSSTPAVDGERVVVYSYHIGLLALDHAGNQLWERKLPPPETMFCPATSPILKDDRVYLCLEGKKGEEFGGDTSKPQVSALYAFDANDGSLLWEAARPFGTMSYSTPVIWEREGQDGRVEELVVFGGSRLAGHDLRSGEMKWWVAGFPRVSNMVPALGDGMIFVGATALVGFSNAKYDGPSWETFMSHDQDGDGVLAFDELAESFTLETRSELPLSTPGYVTYPFKVIAQSADQNKDGLFSRDEFDNMVRMMETFDSPVLMGVRPVGQGDLTESAVAWRVQRAIPEAPSLIYYQSRLYSVKDGGIVVCYDPRSGEVLYHERLGAGGLYTASPVAASGRVFFCSANGAVTVVEAGDEFKILARNKFDEAIYATPAFVGDRLCIRTFGHLYGFESIPDDR